MLVEMRTYTIKPGRVEDFLRFYQEHGWALQQQYLGTCVGWYASTDGPLFQVVHLWAYRDHADRQRRREALYRDPAWLAYFAGVTEQGLLVAAENKFLAPTSFSPVPVLPPADPTD